MKRKNPNLGEDVFLNLTKSAFEFLEQAIKEFKSSPKFSTIHFAIVVELFLKARLMCEHWSLTVESLDKTSRIEFREGKSKTVSLTTSIARLRNIAGINIPKDAFDAFESIAEHRNRMIHFVHSDDKSGDKTRTLETVAIEQCRGWLHLERLLSEWNDQFGAYAERIKEIRRSMKSHRQFLSVVYERAKKQIEGKIKGGTRFVRCHSCEYESAEVRPISDQLSEQHCLVCETGDTRASIECPECENGLEITGYNATPATCPNCDVEIESDVLA